MTCCLARGLLLIAVISCANLRTARAEEELLFPGPFADDIALTGDELAALEAKEKGNADKHLRYAKALVLDVRKHGASRARSLTFDVATIQAALPACAHYLLVESFNALPTIYQKDKKAAPRYYDKIVSVAMQLEVRNEQTPRVRNASAYGYLAHQWCRLLTGKPVDEEALVHAAATVDELQGTCGKPSKTWSAFVRAMMRAEQKDAREWAQGQAVRLADADPSDPTWAKIATRAGVERGIALAGSDPTDAKRLLKKYLPALTRPGAVSAKDKALVALHNNAITAARRLKLKVKASYITRKSRTVSGKLVLDLPRETGWKRVPVSGDQKDGEWTKSTPKGLIVLRVWKYSTRIDYVDDDGVTIGGDNIGGRRKAFFRSAKYEMKKVRKANPRIKSPSRQLAKVTGFDVVGETAKGLPFRIREWYFKVEKVWALNVCAREWGDFDTGNPELEYVLSTLRPPADR